MKKKQKKDKMKKYKKFNSVVNRSIWLINQSILYDDDDANDKSIFDDG